MANRLSRETSPYLRQHEKNPVDWYPWGPEALDKSVAEDRPILLSVGYSSCHWCHVMERESFEDPATAALMNELYVNIKVDREERPDIDAVYMKAVQAMTGRGGWPMTVFLTPGRVPFFAGTYYPPEPAPGMPSFRQVLEAVADAWQHRRDDVHAGSSRLLEALEKSSTTEQTEASATAETLQAAYRTLASQYDPTHGGFGRAPKFPQPVTLEFLMRFHAGGGSSNALEMALHTLRRMAAGGMRDHLGGGFHRYSVDARWLVPHFEKMLYDNALLASAFLDAWKLTDSDDLRDVVVHTLDYLAEDLRSPAGGFYSARDADSEGEEGTFYVWSPEEVDVVVGSEDAALFRRTYDVSDRGNFEGRNILHLPHEPSAVASAEGVSEADLEQRMSRARARLLARRAEREAPFRDEKVIVSWNGLAIRAFAEAGAALGRPDYVETASQAATFLWSEMRREDRLLHSWIEGDARIHAFLDDHASLGNAFLSLHGATLEARWLEGAQWLCEEILARFRDPDSGVFFDTAHDAEALIVRPRDPMDNATPSGASLTAELLLRAGRILDDTRYLDAAHTIVEEEADALARFGPAFGRMLSVLDRELSTPVEIAIVGGRDDTTAALVRAAHERFLPGGVIAGRLDEETPAPERGLLAGRNRVEGAATAYVCENYACSLPVRDTRGLRAALREIDGPLRSTPE